MTFDQAFEKLIGHEGGYVNHPNDPGGETNFGISKRAYPHEDIRGMTIERAKVLYRRDYWDAAGCDAVPEAAKFQVFDMAVNSGVRAAIKNLQKTVGVMADGVIGPKTLQALQSMPAQRFIAHFNAQRLAFMAGLSTWPTFGRGWALRIADNLLES